MTTITIHPDLERSERQETLSPLQIVEYASCVYPLAQALFGLIRALQALGIALRTGAQYPSNLINKGLVETQASVGQDHKKVMTVGARALILGVPGGLWLSVPYRIGATCLLFTYDAYSNGSLQKAFSRF